MAENISKNELKALPITDYHAIRSELKTGDLFFGSGSYFFSSIIQRLARYTVGEDASDFVMILNFQQMALDFIPLSKMQKKRPKPLLILGFIIYQISFIRLLEINFRQNHFYFRLFQFTLPFFKYK